MAWNFLSVLCSLLFHPTCFSLRPIEISPPHHQHQLKMETHYVLASTAPAMPIMSPKRLPFALTSCRHVGHQAPSYSTLPLALAFYFASYSTSFLFRPSSKCWSVALSPNAELIASQNSKLGLTAQRPVLTTASMTKPSWEPVDHRADPPSLIRWSVPQLGKTSSSSHVQADEPSEFTDPAAAHQPVDATSFARVTMRLRSRHGHFIDKGCLVKLVKDSENGKS